MTQAPALLVDGLCFAEAGGIWVASPISDEVLRVVEGGEVSDRIKLDAHAIACTLGRLG